MEYQLLLIPMNIVPKFTFMVVVVVEAYYANTQANNKREVGCIFKSWCTPVLFVRMAPLPPYFESRIV